MAIQSFVHDAIKTYQSEEQINIAVVMVSGGPDSICLLDAVNKSNLFSQINVLYVEHNDIGSLPVEETKKYCSQLGDFRFHGINKKEYKAPSETRWRLERYHELKKLISSLEEKCIVFTGHHKDDLIENYLVSIFKNRVNNVDIPYFREINEKAALMRPLLKFTKEEILSYCTDNKISFFVDETNYQMGNIRNVIRNGLIPNIKNLKDDSQYFNSLEKFMSRYMDLEALLGREAESFIKENVEIFYQNAETTVEMCYTYETEEIVIETVLKKIILAEFGFQPSIESIKAFVNIFKKDVFKKGQICFEFSNNCTASYSEKLDTLTLKGVV